MYNRLIKPLWGKKKVYKNGEFVKNPDFVKEIKGPDIFEGCFEKDYLEKKNEEGYNIYFFPNHPSKNPYTEDVKFLSGKYIDKFNYVFVDMDLKDGIYKDKEDFLEKLKQFPLKPTMTLDSGNGIHSYWKVSDLEKESYILIQFGLINHFKTDDSVWTVLQLMRFPESKNTKDPDNFKQTQILKEFSTEEEYKVEQILSHLDVEDDQVKKAERHIDKLEGRLNVELSDDINADELPDRFLRLMYKDTKIYNLFTDPTEYYGDRSGADAALVNLLWNKNFNKNDVISVIANSKKALSKGANRMDYAISTVEKFYEDRAEYKFLTVGEKQKRGIKNVGGEPVNGPSFFDCLEKRWYKKQVLGLIAGSGVGKTAVSLCVFKHMIENNPHNEDVFVFFSLEMPEFEIEERWINLVGKNSPLSNRLYVIGNEDENGDPRNIGLQEVYNICEEIKKVTGKKIGSVAIDHIGLLNNIVDIRKKPSFGAKGDIEGGWGMERALSMPNMCKAMKPLAKMLNTFLIVLTQTTKSKGAGDVPIDKDGAFGTASYEWMMDYIITLWQPLMRVQKDTDLKALAWQYVKIRSKSKNDRIPTHKQMLLNYDMDSGDLRPMEYDEKAEFDRMLPEANKARKSAEKKESEGYYNSPDLKKLKLIMGEKK